MPDSQDLADLLARAAAGDTAAVTELIIPTPLLRHRPDGPAEASEGDTEKN
jgi:hypothetical protein